MDVVCESGIDYSKDKRVASIIFIALKPTDQSALLKRCTQKN